MIRKLLLAILLFQTTSSFACSCKKMKDVQSEFERADVVFVGKILSKELVKIKNIDNTYYSINKYKIKVTKIYKSRDKSKTITILTPAYTSACGAKFEINSDYIIYGAEKSFWNQYSKLNNSEPNLYWTSRCHRNRKYSKEEIQAIEKIVKQ
jgi:Tissue inhibitor of metalloproteinase